MKFLAFILNLPWTVAALLGAVISIPKRITINKNPFAFVFNIQSFWWYTWLTKMKYARAMALGNVVLLGPNILKNDLEHELIHVEQSIREPFIHPVLYWIETFKKGYRNNKYEIEAYSKSNNVYIER